MQASSYLKRYAELDACMADIQAGYRLLQECYRNGGKVLLCGNGGSAADCEHIVGELMKSFVSPRPLGEDERRCLLETVPQEGAEIAGQLQGALPAISLVSQSALISAYANDVSPEMIYAQQVYGYGRAGDVLIGISTSGNSRNVVRALQVARAFGLHTLGLTGRDGGQMAPWCDVVISVPGQSTADIQGVHQVVYHALCAMLEDEFFPQGA